jgi:hypothetical protein
MTCTVCNEAMVDDPRVMCRACARSYSHNKIEENTIYSVIEWAANRARKAEHKRMADKVKELELKLRIEIAATDGLIRKYGTTTTEIGDMNAK